MIPDCDSSAPSPRPVRRIRDHPDSQPPVHIPRPQTLQQRILAHPYLFMSLLAVLLLSAIHAINEDIEARDHRGWTPLMQAAYRGDEAEVDRLLAKGARLQRRDPCRWTALMRAASGGHTAIVERLLSLGADANDMDKAGYTAVMVAAADNHHEVIRILASHGADLDRRDDTLGWTALIWAAREGHRESARVLLALGANTTLKDHQGLGAADHARARGQAAIAQLFNTPPNTADDS